MTAENPQPKPDQTRISNADFMAAMAREAGVTPEELLGEPKSVKPDDELTQAAAEAVAERPELQTPEGEAPDPAVLAAVLEVLPRTSRPVAELVNSVVERLGDRLTPKQVELLFNHDFITIQEAYADVLSIGIHSDVIADVVAELLSLLLSECITAGDTVRWVIPETLDGKIANLGKGLAAGHLVIDGNAGEAMGAEATMSARITLLGNAGNFAGAGAGGNAVITVQGDVGGYAGHKMGFGAKLEVEGDAGIKVGDKVSHYATISIGGRAKSLGIPIDDLRFYRGNTTIGGKEIYKDGNKVGEL